MGSIIFFDSEIRDNGSIGDLGAVKEGATPFHSGNKKEFSNYVKGVDFICGHNIFNHDLKYLSYCFDKQIEQKILNEYEILFKNHCGAKYKIHNDVTIQVKIHRLTEELLTQCTNSLYVEMMKAFINKVAE